jgi:hypothetical protein
LLLAGVLLKLVAAAINVAAVVGRRARCQSARRILVCVAAVAALVLGARSHLLARQFVDYAFTTLAGSPGAEGGTDATGSAARFYGPHGVAVDSAGIVYVADEINHTIRKITPAGVVTTLAGLAGTSGSADGTGTAARFSSPSGVAVDGAGTVYVADCDNHTIRRVTPAGVVTTLAGLAETPGGEDGTGAAARFYYPRGVAVDSAGAVYVVDTSNQEIRKITPAGVVTTLAGLAGTLGGADGTGSAARFNSPVGVAVDSAGVIYVADRFNHTVRKVTAGGVVATLAGLVLTPGGADGTGSTARFNQPWGVAVDSAGAVYVADTSNSTIRKVTPAGVVTTLAGLAGTSGSADGPGSAARFNFPEGVAVDSAGAVYVGDSGNSTIRMSAWAFAAQPADQGGPVGGSVTFAAVASGTPAPTYQWQVSTNAGVVWTALTNTGPYTGTSTTALTITGITPGLGGNLFRCVATSGTATATSTSATLSVQYTFITMAGSGSGDGTGNEAGFFNPQGVAVDSTGTVYVSDFGRDTIRKITPAAVVTTLAGSPFASGNTDATGNAARFNGASGVAVDSVGVVYVADRNNHTIRKITPAGVVTTLAGLAGTAGSADGTGTAARFRYPGGVSVDSAGTVYVADTDNHTIRKITPAGVVTTLAGLAGTPDAADGTGTAARFFGPRGVAVDSAGNVYVADSGNCTIRKVTPAGVVTTSAGLAGTPGSSDGAGNAARFNSPYGIAVDSAGVVYVGDTLSHTIRKMIPAGVVTTLAGLPGTSGNADGIGSAARFYLPWGLAVDSGGVVYVADEGNFTIRTSGTVAALLAFTTQPVDQGGPIGSSVTLTAVAPSTPTPTYGWQASTDAGETWTALTNTPPYSGTSTTALTITGITPGLAGNFYRCVATNVLGTAISNSATLSVQYTFTTLAGSPIAGGSTDGIGGAARFSGPSGIAVDNAGVAYIADTGNHTIRKVTPAGVVTTLAGVPGAAGSADGTGSAARFNGPHGVAVDGTGAVYVADTDNHTIRKISPVGVVTTLAGLALTQGSADGTGSTARFNQPWGVAVDGAGVAYVSDTANHTIRKVTPAGAVTTLAGSAGAYGSANGTGSAARFVNPSGIAVDSDGLIYVADYQNFTIRKVTAAGVVTTLAGVPGQGGSADAAGGGARFYFPWGLAVDSAGAVYVADHGNDTIRKITPAGVVTTLAGLPGTPGSADGTGSAARFNTARGVAVNSAGVVFVADTFNSTIRTSGTVAEAPFGFTTQPENQGAAVGGGVTLTAVAAGAPAPAYQWQVSTNGGGAWTALTNTGPYGGTSTTALTITGITQGLWGNLYRCIATSGAETATSNSATLSVWKTFRTLAGLAGTSGSANGAGSAARFNLPRDVAVDSAGTVYVADSANHTIRKVTAAGVVTTLAGLAGTPGSADGTGSAARFDDPIGVAVDSAGVVYVADTGNYTIRKITAAAVVTTLAGLAGTSGSADGAGSAARFDFPIAVAVDSAGVVYVADMNNQTIRKVTPAGVVTTLAGSAGLYGTADGTGSAARFSGPIGVGVDSAGALYVADFFNHAIRKITPAGVVTTLAGVCGAAGSSDGPGSAARFYYPRSVAADSAGAVYVADTSNHMIRKVTPAGVVTTLAGLAGANGSADGTGNVARFYYPSGVAVDSAGMVYVADHDNSTVRTSSTVSPQPVFTTQPVDRAVTVGTNATFAVAASGTPSYQWQVSTNGGSTWTDLANVAPYSGATTTALTVTSAPAGLNGSQYRAVATSTGGTATSTVAAITVGTPAAITTQPLSQTIPSGLTATVSVGATGTVPVNYQWYQGTSGTTTTPISGATGPDYTTPTLVSPTSYWVRLSNGFGSAVDSDTATIAIAASTSAAQMMTPAPMSTLTASRAVFQWTGGKNVSQYYLWVGSTAGSSDLFSQDQGTNLSTTVSGLPVDGSTIYVRLWSLVGPTWFPRDYTYTATTSGPARAQLMSPAPRSTFAASTVSFQWTGGTGVTQYYLWVGTTGVGSSNVVVQDEGTNLSGTVTGLPTNGSTIYVRLWSLIGGTWQPYDYTYAARSTGAPGLAEMTTPAPESSLTASTVSFQWTGGTGVSQYYLWVGTIGAGSKDLAIQDCGTNLNATVIGLPTNGSTVYVRLWSLVGPTWQSHDYTYSAMSTSAAPRAQMMTPPPGSTLPASAVAFEWTGGTSVTQYVLWVGTAGVGSNNLAIQDRGTNLSATVTGLPTNGSALFVRLWSLVSGGWQSNDYTYTAVTSSPSARAQMTSPAPGSTLTASTVEFKWTGGAGVAQYYLWVGTTGAGSNNLANQNRGTNLGAIVTGLPTNGSTLYVRLWSLTGGAWQSYDYTYTATTPTLARAQMLTPAPGSTLAASTVLFQWTGGTGVTQYVLWVGTTGVGSSNVAIQDEGTTLSGTVTGLPTNGSTIYVRLWSLVGGAWQCYDYTYMAP